MLANLKAKYLALSHPTHILIWLVAGMLVLSLLFFVGGKARDAWQLHEYNKVRAADIKKAEDAEKLAQQAIGQAQVAVQQRDAALQQADEAHKQLVEAVQELNDATKTTQQKREEYNKIVNGPAPVVAHPGDSLTDLCATAKKLGIQSSACQ